MKKSILFILCAIILASCSGPRGNSAGSINGTKISNPDFIREYQARTIDFRSIYKHAPNAEEKQQLFEATWRFFGEHVILTDYFKKYHISSSEQEVLDLLSKEVPLIYREANLFKVNGVFDREMYLNSVHSDRPINMADLRKRYLDYHIPIQKLKPYIIENELMDNKTRKLLSESLGSKADFELVVFDPAQIKLTMSEDELRTYYQRNMERYALPAEYALEYLNLPLSMQESDVQYSRAVADSIYQELSYGRNWDTLYQEKRRYLPGLKLSDAEFATANSLSEELLGLLDLLPENKPSRLFPDENGYIIYQKLQRTKSMIRYRYLQIPPQISPATVEAEYAAAVGSLELAQNLGMAVAGQELEREVITSGVLSLGDDWYPDELIRLNVERQLPEAKRGDYLGPLYSPATGCWVIIYISDNKVNRAKAFSQVKDEIESQLISERKKDLVQKKAQDWLRQNPELRLMENSPEYTLIAYHNTGLEATYQGQSLDTIYIKALLAQKEGKSLMVQSFGDASLILIPRKIYPAAKNHVEKELLQEYYLRLLPDNWFNDWLESKIANAKIEIYNLHER